ncbi:unnamed protein product [Cunninghamella blakesleeana]
MVTTSLKVKIDMNEPSSPPPSPPPIHKLYTEISTYNYSNYYHHINTPINHPPNPHHNKSPLLVPKASDLPPSLPDDHDKKQGRIYKYSKKAFIYLLKQLVKKNNLTLLINLIHQLWRGRFFILRNLQYFKHFITTYPFMEEWKLFKTSLLKISKILFIILKNEQHHILKQMTMNSTTTTNATTASTVATYYQPSLSELKLLVSLFYLRFTELYKLCFKYTFKVIKHFSAWDSLIFFISSIALTNSITNSLNHY